MAQFTHFNQSGEAVMVDVSEKNVTQREAEAAGRIHMNEECYQKVKDGRIGKGDVLSVARIAGIMASKQTCSLIPLCHNINLNKAEIRFEMDDVRCAITAFCRVKCDGKTGVEMEALTGVNVALLTIYDMCKAVDKRMHMEGIHLCRKTGGKSGVFNYD